MTSNHEQSKHSLRILAGIIVGVIAIYSDFFSNEKQTASCQLSLWTVFIILVFAVEFRKTLSVRFQQFVAFILLVLHFVFLWIIRGFFPLHNSLFVIGFALLEVVILIVLYMVSGQVLDPAGPYGMTSEDRERRASKRSKRLF